MCDDGHADVEGVAGPSRRRVLQGMVALAALAASGVRPAAAAVLPPRARNADNLYPYALAMHVHASASEGIGSMRAQLAQAALNGFDVTWFTDHDWRRQRLLFRPEYHFNSAGLLGGVWKLPKMADVGSLTSTSGGTLVSTPVNPNDTASSSRSLRLRATSKGTAPATVRYHVDATGSSRANYAARITGRTISVDVLPTKGGPDSWGQVQFMLSRQVAGPTRPAGQVSMLYRLRPDVLAPVYSSQGTQGIVDLPVTLNTWQTIAVDLTADVLRVWPDLDARDNALGDIRFGATSQRKAAAEVYFSNLRFTEQPGYDAFGVEQSILDGYVAQVASVLGLVGTEISLDVHLNQLGGTQAPFPGYGTPTSLTQNFGDLRPAIVDFIHAQGGLASINHPFKPGDSSVAATPQSVALDLLAGRADGADILEVGYAAKGTNGTLANHLAVWDALSRNAVVVTGTGVSDDHTGNGWASQANRFYTGAWASAKEEGALQDALARGRAYVGFLGGFGGSVDMVVDGAPMGSVAVSPSTSRTLQFAVTGLPSGGSVQVVRGDLDYVGDGTPNTSVVSELGPTDPTSLVVDTTDECFYRLQVTNSAGAVVAFGQPIWLVHTAPAGVPSIRLS